EPDDKRLLQAGSVIGKDVPFALLEAIVEVPEEELRSALMRVHAAGLIDAPTLFPPLEYTCKHALTHDVAYGSLLTGRRRALHARAMESLERLNADRLSEQVERLAHHAVRGEIWSKAI